MKTKKIKLNTNNIKKNKFNVGGGSSHEAHVPLPHHAHHFLDSSSWPRVCWCWSGHGFVHGGGAEELLSIESLVSLEEFQRDGCISLILPCEFNHGWWQLICLASIKFDLRNLIRLASWQLQLNLTFKVWNWYQWSLDLNWVLKT